MATRKDTVRARPRRASLPIPTDLVSGNPANELLLDVISSRSRAGKEDIISSANGVTRFAPGLGEISVRGGWYSPSGDFEIGAGTTVVVRAELATEKGAKPVRSASVTVVGSISGGGSLAIGSGTLTAKRIELGGDLTVGHDVKADTIVVGGTLRSGRSIKTKSRLDVGGSLIAAELVDANLGSARISGDVDVSSLEAWDIEVGGSIVCTCWLYAKQGITVGGSILVEEEDIRAGLGITAGGSISAGQRIFSGLVIGEIPSADDMLISCATLAQGTVAYGSLVLHA